jgi:hypothetical protein
LGFGCRRETFIAATSGARSVLRTIIWLHRVAGEAKLTLRGSDLHLDGGESINIGECDDTVQATGGWKILLGGSLLNINGR